MRLRYVVICEREENGYADLPSDQIIEMEKMIMINAFNRHQFLQDEKFQIIVEEVK